MASRNISDQSQAKRVPQSANFAALLEAVALDPAAINSATAPSVTRDAAARKQKSEASGNSQPALSLRSQGRPNRSQVVASPPPPIQQQAKAQPDTSRKKPPKSLRVSKSNIAQPPAQPLTAQPLTAQPLTAKPLAAKPRDLAPRLKFAETKPSVNAAKNPQPSAVTNPFPAALHEDLLATDTVAIHSASPAMAAGPQTAASPAATFAPQAERRSTEHSATQDSVADRLATDRLVTDRQADETWVRWPGPKRKCVTISVRLSPADARMLRRRASESQLSVSDYMRSCVLEADQLRAQVKQALAEMKLQAQDSQATAIREEPAQPYAPMPPKPKESGFKGWFSGLRGPLTTASAMPGQR